MPYMPKFDTYKKLILGFHRKHSRMPRYSEIMELVGLKSKNAVYKLVQKLVGLGIVEQDDNGHLVLKRPKVLVPVLGYVEAGWPSPAEEEILDTISLDEYLIPHRECTYAVK